MKFSPRTFKIQWDLHAWVGVVASILLFVVFYCGVFALFHGALSHWQAPATGDAVLRPEASRVSYDRVMSHVEREMVVPRGASVMLRLPLGPQIEPGVSTVSVYPDGAPARDFAFDRVTGDPKAASTDHSRLADELFALHFFYQLPWGVELSGVVAMALFVAIVSGVVIHWKDLVRQLWQFRPTLRLRFSASDAHKVLGVFGLPFTTVFAWSGALLGLGALLAAPLRHGAFGGDLNALDVARGYRSSPPVEAGRASPRLPLDEIVANGVGAARVHFGSAELQPARLDIELYGDEGARFQVGLGSGGFEPDRGVELDRNGTVTAFKGDASTPTELVDRVLYDLHFARFGGYFIKALFALLSLGVCVVIITGNLIWIERRDPLRVRWGNRALEKLTVGSCCGLVLASAVYALSNRSLELGLPRRADLEFWVFLGTWALSVGGVFVGGSARSWAAALCGAAALGFAGLVLSDGLSRPEQLSAALTGNAEPTLGAELLWLCLALLCAGLAYGMRARRNKAVVQVTEPSVAGLSES